MARRYKARRNMAFPKTIDGVVVDNIEEMKAVLAARQPSMPQGLGSFRPKASSSPKKRRGQVSRKYKDPYAKVALSMGGKEALCPNVDWKVLNAKAKATGKGNYRIILEGYGVDENLLRHIMQAMSDADCLVEGAGSAYKKSQEARQEAVEIFQNVLSERKGVRKKIAKKNSGSIFITYALWDDGIVVDRGSKSFSSVSALKTWYAKQLRGGVTVRITSAFSGNQEVDASRLLARAANNPTAHWTADPTYTYDQFWRGDAPSAPSTYPAKATDWPIAQNAGPFLPQMFPYGQGGRDKTYALNNRGRGAPYLKPETKSWPANDLKHGKLVIQYMSMGRGKPSEYPGLIRELAKYMPLEDAVNKPVWSLYRKLLPKIQKQVGRRKMPSLASLR